MISLSQLFPMPFPHRPWCLFDSRHIRTGMRRGPEWAVGADKMQLRGSESHAIGRVENVEIGGANLFHSVFIGFENQQMLELVLMP